MPNCELEIPSDSSDVTNSFPCFQKFGMSSETLRFLDLKRDFLANKTSDQIIVSGFLIDIEIYRISIFQRKKDYVSFDL